MGEITHPGPTCLLSTPAADVWHALELISHDFEERARVGWAAGIELGEPAR